MIRHASYLSVASFLVLSSLALGCDDDGEGDGSGGSSSTSTTSTSTTSTTSAGGSGGEGGAGGGASGEPVEIQFAGHVGAAAFDCASTYQLGTASTDVTISDFRLYVHDVRLVTATDEEVPVSLTQDGLWQHQDLALLDFEDKTGACANGTTPKNTSVRGTVPPGDYVGLAFEVGVPAALNQLDASSSSTPSPLNLTAMYWSWTTGYKYLRADVARTGLGPFNLHVGATGCSGDPAIGETLSCTRPNVASVRLASFDVASDVVIVDLAAALATTDLSVADAGGAPGCMSGLSDPECGPIFPLLGIDLATGAPDASTQTLFRVD